MIAYAKQRGETISLLHYVNAFFVFVDPLLFMRMQINFKEKGKHLHNFNDVAKLCGLIQFKF
jgi:hypothetical protein